MLRLLGQGGMGQVYLARDDVLGRSVALKVVSERFLERPEARRRFLREARSMATVEHPSVVRVYSFGEADCGAYFVMEYVEGEALSERLRRGRLAIEETLLILEQVIDGLEAAWDKGVVHRDVKPGNVLLDRKGGAHVSDFGLAKPVSSEGDSSLTETDAILGTPFYVSPEQARGLAVDHRSDIYSLGIMAFELLAGDRPFVGTTSFEVVAKHLHEPLPDLRKRRPEVPEALCRALEWMTAKDPASRPASYAALRQALAPPGAPAPSRVSALPTRIGEPPATRLLRAPAWRARLGTALVAAVLVGVATWRLQSPSRRAPSDPKRLVVAVAPFYGLDPESAAEGRTVAGLVEREVVRRLGSEGARVIGVDETREPVRDQAAARALGERLGASVVVWGDAYAAKGETQIQPSFTLITRVDASSSGALRTALAGRDPSDALRELSAAAGATPQAAGQIALRRTTASGVSDVVLLLAGMHRLYIGEDAEGALSLFDRAPRSSESLRHRAAALSRLGRREAAEAALHEALALDPQDAQAHATLADFLIETDRLLEAAREFASAAELKSAYATRNGILFEGKLYLRETYTVTSGLGKGQRQNTGYLLAVEPRSGRVLERHRPPAITDLTLSVRDAALRLDYAEPDAATARFAKGRFEKPVFYGSSMLARRRGVSGGTALAVNFLAAPGGRWQDQPAAEPVAGAPATLPELETRLRREIERDPTQPWHLVWLGQALAAQRRAAEAREVWTRLFDGGFPATPYYEYAWMARHFEASLRQPDWADRAYAEALARRLKLPQPIVTSTLIERLINAPFVSAAAEMSRDDGDLERGYLWLQRARELSGLLSEGDSLAAAAWKSYFGRQGDETRARQEAAVAEAARAMPGNYELANAACDLAVQIFLAATLAAWLFTALSLLHAWRPGTMSSVVGRLRPRERRVLLGASLLPLVAFAVLVEAKLRLSSIAEIPVVLMDSFGSAHSVSDLERRLARHDAPALRLAAAIANHMAGNLDRARELYRCCVDEPRVRRNQSALGQGERTPPEPLTPADFFAAYAARPWHDRLTLLRQEAVPVPPALLDLVLLLGLSALFVRVPPALSEPPLRRRLLHPAVPGSAALQCGAPASAYLTLLLLVFSLVVAGVQAAARSPVPVMGFLSSKEQVSLKAFPLPLRRGVPLKTDAEYARAVQAFYWDFLRARPEVLGLWTAGLLAAGLGVALHLRALRRWRTLAESIDSSGTPSPPAAQPKTLDASETTARPAPPHPA
jgi:tetratricopeptide (TPR) repeat protein/predicted Ser/Thr protein kinase